MNAGDAVCRSLGIAVEEVAEGRARLRMRISEDMLNGHGLAHGGYLFLLADAAFAHASNARGPVTLAQSAQVTFLRPAEVGEELLAEATERVRYGRHGVYDVTVRRPCGEIVAEFRGQSVTISGRPGLSDSPGFSDRSGRLDSTGFNRPVSGRSGLSDGPGGSGRPGFSDRSGRPDGTDSDRPVSSGPGPSDGPGVSGRPALSSGPGLSDGPGGAS